MAQKNLGIILTAILIVGGLLALAGYKSIPDLVDGLSQENSVPFTVQLSPLYFDEGSFDYNYKIPFSIEAIQKNKRNITYLELSQDNFKVSRDDGGLNKPTSNVRWKDSRSENIFYFDPSRTYSYKFPSSLKSEGEMVTCPNCFIGDTYPYIFTFTIYYKENDGDLKSETFEEIIPIK